MASFLFAAFHRGATQGFVCRTAALPAASGGKRSKKQSHLELQLSTGQSLNDGLGLNYHKKKKKKQKAPT